MKKFFSLFFLSLLLLVQTPLQQFLKLPVLASHFREHRAETRDISFAQFIVLHYFSGNPVDEDYDRDQQLPFRSHDVVVISSVVLIPEQIIPEITPLVYQTKHYPFLSISYLSSSYANGPWQPPKFS